MKEMGEWPPCKDGHIVSSVSLAVLGSRGNVFKIEEIVVGVYDRLRVLAPGFNAIGSLRRVFNSGVAIFTFVAMKNIFALVNYRFRV